MCGKCFDWPLVRKALYKWCSPFTIYLLSAGEPRKYDPTFKGPIHSRGCTDIACCVLFIVAILAYVAGAVLWAHGPLTCLSLHRKKPLLFYFNIMKCASPMVLLEFQCPTTQVWTPLLPFSSSSSSQSPPLPHKLHTQLEPLLSTHNKVCVCAVTRRCFPALAGKDGSITVGNSSGFDDGTGTIREAKDLVDGVKLYCLLALYCLVTDLRWVMTVLVPVSPSGLVIAMLTSLLFIVLLRFLAGIMVWVMIVMVILVIGYGIFHCYMEYAALKGAAGSNVTLQDLGFQTDITVYLQIRQTWLAFMIILAIVEVVIILILIFLRKRILIAIALIKEASRAIGHVMSSLFYPLFTFLLLAMVIAYWAVTAVFLSTSNEPVYKVFNETECMHSRMNCEPANFSTSAMKADCQDSECLFAFYGGETAYHKYLIGLQFYNVFLFFWCANFVTALGQMTLAGAFSSYYWAFVKPDDMPAFPVFAALGRSLRYHTGTLAFGSLILSIVQIIRVLLEYIDHKLKGAHNKCTRFLLCCLKCCFWCLEKFVKFLNRNAYIMVAIYGKNFCTSAKDAFFLLMRNMIRVAVLDKVTDFLLFLGKLLIVGIVGIFAFFFFSGRVKAFEDTAPHLHYYWVPILTVVVGSYLIAHGFFSVYAMCVDTLFLCFCEDLERNDGSAERPYLMSSTLHDILWEDKEPPESQGAEEEGDPPPSEAQI
uniref:Choline transporter-like protein n=1 Tax=Gadus morhua TaxID=8049 RepID=A0A8C5FK40_GADMO